MRYAIAVKALVFMRPFIVLGPNIDVFILYRPLNNREFVFYLTSNYKTYYVIAPN